MDKITAVWTLLAIILGITEAATMGLVSIWFCLAAVISALVSLVTDSFWIQFGVFVISSAVFLAATRSLSKKLLDGKKIATNSDALIGMSGITIIDIDPVQNTGQVKVNGQIWSTRADEFIPVGTKVKVENITGVKLVVNKEE